MYYVETESRINNSRKFENRTNPRADGARAYKREVQRIEINCSDVEYFSHGRMDKETRAQLALYRGKLGKKAPRSLEIKMALKMTVFSFSH